MKLLVVAVVACLARAQDTTDALRAAIKGKTSQQLREIILKVHETMPGSIEMPPFETDDEVLRAIVFEHAQKERPPPGGIKPWIEGQPLRSKSTEIPSPKVKVEGFSDGMDEKGFASVVKTLFKQLDVDKDKKLTREEMAGMVEKVNAAAKAKGEAPSDLFDSLDVNKDGYVEAHEATGLFKHIMDMHPSKTAATDAVNDGAAGEASKMARMMFQGMDKNGDNKLDEAEMGPVLEKTKADAKARGSDDYVDFASIDANKDGFIDREEAGRFFEALTATVEQGDDAKAAPAGKAEKEEKAEL